MKGASEIALFIFFLKKVSRKYSTTCFFKFTSLECSREDIFKYFIPQKVVEKEKKREVGDDSLW